MKPVFIHISKNAGTSIIASAGDNIIVAGHRTASSWVAEQGHAAPLFAVIRNPYDRVVSEYFYRKRRYEAGENNPHLGNLGRTFDEWVIATFRDGEFRTQSFFLQTGVPYNSRNMIDGSLIWFIPQARWLGGDGEGTLADDLLRHESLEDDWTRFSSKYGFNAVLERRNASPRDADFDAYYTEQSRELVFRHYRVDFEVFGYRR